MDKHAGEAASVRQARLGEGRTINFVDVSNYNRVVESKGAEDVESVEG